MDDVITYFDALFVNREYIELHKHDWQTLKTALLKQKAMQQNEHSTQQQQADICPSCKGSGEWSGGGVGGTHFCGYCKGTGKNPDTGLNCSCMSDKSSPILHEADISANSGMSYTESGNVC